MLKITALVLFLMKEIKDGLATGTSSLGALDSHCTDYSGRIYEHGMHYMPENICNLCICDNGEPKGCKMVLCTALSECKSFQLGNNRCEYVCLDDTLAERTQKTQELKRTQELKKQNHKTPESNNNEKINDQVDKLLTNTTEKNDKQSDKPVEQPIEQQQQEEKNVDDNDKNEIRPCTCGIFLSNKVEKQKILVDDEEPTFTQELEKKYPCTKLGVRQCQNDCFQTMIKYLPKSGEIICGLINEDIYKLKAHLFIQNCDNKWYNSNLVTGRE